MKSSDAPIFCPDPRTRTSSIIPLFIKISALIIFFIVLTLIIVGGFFWSRQRDILYQEKVMSGEAIVRYFGNGARIPLLGDDTLSLNTLLNELSNTDGFLYATIFDRDGIIRAHIDPGNIRSAFNRSHEIKGRSERKGTACLEYMLPTGAHVLELSRPIMFRTAKLGSVHLGLSLNLINEQIRKNNLALIGAALPFCLVIIFLGLGTSALISSFLSRRVPQPHWVWGGKGKTESAAAVFPYNKRLSPLDITRNQVTVLFAGVKGFKKYADNKKSEEALADLNEYFSIAVNQIQGHGGYIDKFIGDAVIGVFGSSPLEVDHAQRAVKCAADMQRAFRSAGNTDNRLLGLVGIGISSGVVLSGIMGSHAKKQYTFIGESFKSAYFLSVMAGPGEIVISKDVYQIMENLVSVEPLPPREMIDRSESWESFRLKSSEEG